MKSRGYVSIEQYEDLLEQLKAVKFENQQLHQIISQQESIISELRTEYPSSHLLNTQSTGGWFKPPTSPRQMPQPKTRSGSVQSRRSFFSVRRSSNLNSPEDIDEEIRKAEELREKSYEELMNNHSSPSKISRLKNIVERWDIEIQSLKRKKQELLEYGNY